ncbi:hypothetical protein ACEWY4_006198 [Coilia grayii]|uniref:Envelope glycoprotein n=1 Tax=Coilia grayii TaxID=363190 RepID=A0ABD1KD99_9TELE
MRTCIKCIGVLLFFLLFFVSPCILLTWGNLPNVHNALLEMFYANTSKAISPTSGSECRKPLNWWMPPTPLQEADETDWWETILQVLRIDKIRRWTMQEKGLLSRVWDYCKTLFRNRHPANDTKPRVKRKARTTISPTNKYLGYSWLFLLIFVMGWIWKSRRKNASEITALEILSDQLNSQSDDLQKMLDLLQKIQERVTQMEECLNAVTQPRQRAGCRAQKSMPMTFSDSSASSD